MYIQKENFTNKIFYSIILSYTNVIGKVRCKNEKYYKKRQKIRYNNMYEFVEFILELIEKILYVSLF